MDNFTVVFYEENGKTPVWDFILSLKDDKMKAKIVGMLELLEKNGTNLREPYSKHLEDGIFELRCKQSNNITRILYFFYVGKNIIMTNGFVKKTQKTPTSEIALAKKRRSIYLKGESIK